MHWCATRTYKLCVGVALALGACAQAAPAPQPTAAIGVQTEALFSNGGFETDALNAAPASWTVDAYLNHRVTLQSPETRSGLALDSSGGLRGTRALGAATPESLNDPVATNLHYPKYGTRSAVINFYPGASPAVSGANQNVNGLKQQMTIAAGDVDPDDSQIHIRFVLAPVLENPAHDVNEQPYYFIQIRNVSRGTVLYQEFEVSNQSGVPWQSVGMGTARLYTDWQLVDVAPPISALAVGDTIETEVIAAGCSRGQHFGRVYVDAFGAALPGLFTSATAPATATAGSDFTYAIHYKNGATTAAANPVLDFVIPPQTTFVSTSAGSACTTPMVNSTGTVSCGLTTLQPGDHGDFQITVHVDPTATGTIVQGNYSIRATGVSPLLGSHVVTTIPGPKLVVNVSSGLARVGWNSPISYTITITNTGSSAANNVSILETLPMLLTNPTWACSGMGGGSCAANGSAAISDNTVSLPVGASVTYVLTGQVGNGMGNNGQIINSVSASTPAAGGGTISATSSETLVVANVNAIVLTKTSAGAVSSDTSGLACGPGCTSRSAYFVRGSDVVLNAVAPSGGSFTGWSGACSGAGAAATCTVNNLNADVMVGATFGTASISIVSGGSQKTRVGSNFAAPLVVLVLDASAQPLANATVQFSGPTTGASVVLPAYSVVTDMNGHATLMPAANLNAGDYNVNASLNEVSGAVQFPLRNLGPPALVTLISGSGQTTTVHDTASNPLVVRITDSTGAPLEGVSVTFSAPSTGATSVLASNPVLTDANGLASTAITANETSGNYAIVASVSGVALGASFDVTNAAGAAVTIGATLGSTPQSARVTTAFANPLQVRVLDQFGNPVSGVSIEFAAPLSDPSAELSATAVTTNAQGEASVSATALKKAGRFQVTATLPDKTVATFALTDTAGDPLSIAIADGDGQSALATQAFGDPITVLVLDADGNPVRGSKVTVSVSGDAASGTPSASEVTTDENGHASVELTAGAVPGSLTVSLSIDGGATPASTELTVEPIPTETVLVVSPRQVDPGEESNLTATVTSDHGTPSGQVTFTVSGETVGQVDLDDGTARVKYSGDVGAKEVTAEYAAQGSYAESSSNAISLDIGVGAGSAADGGGNIAADAAAHSGGGKPSAATTSTRGWQLQGGSCAVARGQSGRGGALWLLAGLAACFVRRRRRQR
jgi:uncharacterized repeat protein (TIGR01451 family)